ncbi:MAG TPA: peptidase domain-containing ABC transporter [Chloroflexia bacterium]|nr:peptidase domain-containing ABC transporter [Chloroflexia bacterium]
MKKPAVVVMAFFQKIILFFKNLVKSLHFNRVPEILQLEATECGAACLAMVLNYYGLKTSVSEVRERCGVGRDGLSALSIVKAGRSYGLRAKGLSVKNNDFKYVQLPAIVHWQFNHFLVLERWTPRKVYVVDPAMGRRCLTREEFEEGFTGVLVTLEPGNQFERRREGPPASLGKYLRYLLRSRWVVAQVIMVSLLLQLVGLGLPFLTKLVVDQVIPSGLNSVLLLLGMGMLALVLAQLLITLLRASLLVYLQARLDTQMMLGFFEHLLSLPYRFFLLRSSGDMLTRMASNTVIRDTLTGQLLSLLLDSTLIVVYLAVLFWQSTVFGAVVCGLGLLQVVILLVTARPLRELTSRDLLAQGKAQGYLNEALAGIATVKAAGAEQRTLNRWSNFFYDQLNVSVRRNYLSAVVDSLISCLRTFSPLALLWLGTVQVLDGNMSIGTMLALNSLAASCLTPLASLVSSGQRLQLVRAHFDRVADVHSAEPEQSLAEATLPPALTGQIELRNVSFKYDPNAPFVLQGINLSIKPGQKVALVGKTGSGKSTLARLLLGLYLPTEGEIYYDNLPLSSLNYQAVRSQFGIVLQDTYVFSGTIRQNIAFNNPEVGLEKVVEATRLAGLHDDLAQMPMGYETYVSEGGSALSGGQRQRLALARALAHSPSVLLLDEATSNLDVLTEQVVDNNLNRLNCTRIVIAHRLSTIRNSDLILVVDRGRLIEQGTHEELMAQQGYYASLVSTQFETATSGNMGR